AMVTPRLPARGAAMAAGSGRDAMRAISDSMAGARKTRPAVAAKLSWKLTSAMARGDIAVRTAAEKASAVAPLAGRPARPAPRARRPMKPARNTEGVGPTRRTKAI